MQDTEFSCGDWRFTRPLHLHANCKTNFENVHSKRLKNNKIQEWVGSAVFSKSGAKSTVPAGRCKKLCRKSSCLPFLVTQGPDFFKIGTHVSTDFRRFVSFLTNVLVVMRAYIYRRVRRTAGISRRAALLSSIVVSGALFQLSFVAPRQDICDWPEREEIPLTSTVLQNYRRFHPSSNCFLGSWLRPRTRTHLLVRSQLGSPTAKYSRLPALK